MIPLDNLDSIRSTDLGLLLAAGSALSSEKDIDSLMERIITTAMALTHADGGTLYRVSEDGHLAFSILCNQSLNIHMGGKSGAPVSIPPLPLYKDGIPDHSSVVCHAIHTAQTVNIADAYAADQFDFSGTRATDARLGYRSQSFLTVPLKNHETEIIGVLQLINAQDPVTGDIIPFKPTATRIVEALASQAAVSLTNRLLINQLAVLFESFIGLINHAIDDKSPYTSGHCGRVPELTMMMADAVNRCDIGPLRHFTMTEADRYELKIAGLLHDCGKITTPIHVVDKGTKLETLFDRIQLIDLREAIVARDLEIAHLKGKLDAKALALALDQLRDDCQFLRTSNKGTEFMAPEAAQRVLDVAQKYHWQDHHGETLSFLSDDEIHNLTISSGTLTAEERKIINRHIDVPIAMLEKLPWPNHLKNVVEYAGGHHERMDGKGYPKGLTRDQMSVQARCMAIADVFEALTARDRPYKAGKTLSESLTNIVRMNLDQHLDPDLFDIFIWDRVYEEYARKFLNPEQIDKVDVSKIPGYTPPSNH
ncbi:MAG: HD domain-containing phosphohydrolase [Fluviibacter sp.]